uniref:Peptidase_M13 domain-containing protein n=1 Tax=Steinernema glaseri TaxID=37863 RepID=A0A1I8APY4_9BILA
MFAAVLLLLLLPGSVAINIRDWIKLPSVTCTFDYGLYCNINKKPDTSQKFYRSGEWLQKAMDSKEAPCTNFYKHACGNWQRNNDLGGMPTISVMRNFQAEITRDMIEVFKDRTHSGSRIIEGMKTAFRKCVAAEKDHVVDYFFDRVKGMGGWPLVDDHYSFKMPDITRLLLFTKNKALLFIGPKVDTSNKEGLHKQILSVSASRIFDLFDKNYANTTKYPELINDYKEYMREKVELLRQDCRRIGWLCTTRRISSADIDRMFALEKRLVSASSGKETLISFGELKKTFPEIRWDAIIKEYGGRVRDSAIVSVNMDYVKAVLHEYSTNRTTFTNYAFWRYFRVFYLDRYQLPGDYSKVSVGVSIVTSRQLMNQTREEACASTLNYFREMPIHATGVMYAKKHLPDEAIAEVKDMLERIKKTFKEILREGWMKGDVQKKAIEKLDKMQFNIGYPKWAANNYRLDHYYENLDITEEDSYSTIIERIAKFIAEEDMARVGKELRRDEFKYPSGFANAALSADKNAMEMCGGLFRFPYFSLKNPKAVNYAMIGSVLAHEMSHTFDMTGHKYDSIGNLNNWWDPSSLQEYNNRTDCYVEQFNKYHIPDTDLHVDGKATLSENIADSQVQASLRAYRDYLKTLPGGKEESVPGLEHLTNEQIFWLAYGGSYCAKTVTAEKIYRSAWDTHSPEDFRIIGQAHNSKEFQEAFQCTQQDYMVPKKRCAVFN